MWIILFFVIQALALLRKERLWLYVMLSASYCLWFVYAIVEHRPGIEILCTSALLSIALTQSVHLWRRTNRLDWTAEEQVLRERFFSTLSKESFYALIHSASWRNFDANELLLEEGQPVGELLLLYDGLVTVDVHKKPITRLSAGRFIGEMSFVSGAPASATVRALEPTRCVAWNAERLHDLLFRDNHIKSAFQAMLQGDLQEKLTHREPQNL